MGNDTSSTCLPHDPAPFPFFDLPALVQWQILRQYLPFSEKTTVLGNMPEFACLMDPETPCWLHDFRSLYQLLPLLCRLLPGFYVRSDDSLPHHGYYVHLEQEDRISFLCCAVLTPYVQKYNQYFSLITMKEVTFVEPVASVANFLRAFLSQYILEADHPVESYTNGNYTFLVNKAVRKVLWDDLTKHDIFRTGNCYVEYGKGKMIRLTIRPRQKTVTAFDGRKTQQVPRDESLSDSICWSAQLPVQFCRYYMVSKCSLHISKNSAVKVSMQVYNPPVYQYYKENSYCAFSWFERKLDHLLKL